MLHELRISMIYHPLNREHNQIRLLTLRASNGWENVRPDCCLETFSLDNLPQYIALSYVWGDPTITRELAVDGTTLHVTANLAGALQRFRHPDRDLRLWVDAVCINQDDLQERGHQVQLMQRIYKQAEKVWVWLGEEADNSAIAMELIELLSYIQTDCKNQTGKYYVHDGRRYDTHLWGPPDSWGVSQELVALDRLLARPWWFRVWIIQEVAVAGEVIVFCGNHSVSWQQVVKCGDFLVSHKIDFTRIVQTSSGRICGLPGLIRVGGIDEARVIIKCGGKYPILVLLSQHQEAKATDPRDKFIALAGLAREHSLVDDNYYFKSISEVYTKAVCLIAESTRHGRLNFLSYAGLPQEVKGLPSWVPDWGYAGQRPCAFLKWQLLPKEVSSFYGKVDIFNPAGRYGQVDQSFFFISTNQQILNARGIEFDTIDGLSPNLPRAGLQELVYEYTAEYNGYFLPQHPTFSLDDNFDVIYDNLWRTLVMNKGYLTDTAPDEWAQLFWIPFILPELYKSVHDNYIRDWYHIVKDLPLETYTVDEILHKAKAKYTSNWGEWQIGPDERRALTSITSNLVGATTFRRLATSKAGHIALVPADTQRDDRVCILFDCDVPLILRPCEQDNFTVIGECYVHSIMKGQATKDESNVEVVSFCIH